MELLYLGTGAAEGVPALYCACEMCRYAFKAGGREIRMRSGALLDGTIKLDFGPDSYQQMLANRLDYARIAAVLITHSHFDHLCESYIDCRSPKFAHVLLPDAPPMTVYGNAAVEERTRRYIDGVRTLFHPARSFEPFTVQDYRVTPLEAVHCVEKNAQGWPVAWKGRTYARREDALIYLIEHAGKTLLYAHDTGGLTDRTLKALSGKRLDLISLDCTMGCSERETLGHMNVAGVLRTKETLLALGVADARTVFVANHFSHGGLRPLARMEELLPGFIVAYDGLRVSA